jgi:hypothetical protein
VSEALDISSRNSESLTPKSGSHVVNLDKVLEIAPLELSEEDRIAHVSSVRDALEAIANTKRPSIDILSKKIKLLRLWCILVKLRVESVKADKPPPENHTPGYRRGGSKTKFKLAPKRNAETTKSLGKEQSVTDKVVANGSGRIELRLLEAGVVNGVMLPAGVVVEVEPHDAAELLENKMAIKNS